MLNVLHAVFKLKYPLKEDPRVDNKPKEMLRSVFNIGSSQVSLVDLKKFCIHIFASLLSVPNHFSHLAMSEPNSSSSSSFSSSFHAMRTKVLEIFLAAMTNEQDTGNLQLLFGCGKLIVGEWSLDEAARDASVTTTTTTDKKERASYCYNQIVTLICAPLRINHSTLQNHLFALSIFDSLASIVATGDMAAVGGSTMSADEDNVSRLAVAWIWHYVKMQIRRRSKEHTKVSWLHLLFYLLSNGEKKFLSSKKQHF